MKKEIFLMVIFSIALVKMVYAQHVRVNVPLFKFLQQNADSTLAIESVTNWVQKPKIMILSKRKDTLSTYLYADNRKFDQSGTLPKIIRDSIYSKNRMNIFFIPIAVNPYFNPKYLDADSIHVFWKKVSSVLPWQLKDDKMDKGEGCPVTEKEKYAEKYIYDGGGVALYLITKKEIKSLYLYVPDYFEKKEVCPGNINRKAVLKLLDLFAHYFNGS